MKFSLIALVCLWTAVFSGYAQKMNTITFNFEDTQFDGLTLKLGTSGETINVAGVSEDRKCWRFSYPDSLYDRLDCFQIEDSRTNDSLSFFTNFTFYIGIDTVSSALLYCDNKDFTIDARYDTTVYMEKSPVFRDRIPVINEFIVDGDITDIQCRAAMLSQKRGFMRFTEEYDIALEKYLGLIREFPYSRHMMMRLFSSLRFFKNKADVLRLYREFDPEVQNSYYGREVHHYLNPPALFENFSLQIWNDPARYEDIIISSEKYNLIVFSASWCQPCHKQIPILKEIHKDLGDRLEMVYISTDKEESIGAWQDVMTEYGIQWRSLLAGEKSKELSRQYSVHAIPFTILVAPDGSYEKFDVRNDENRQKLYRLLSD